MATLTNTDAIPAPRRRIQFFKRSISMPSMGKSFIYALLLLFSTFFLFPLVWMVGTSFKTVDEVSQSQLVLFPQRPMTELGWEPNADALRRVVGLPMTDINYAWAWDNYADMFQDPSFALAYGNSVFIVIIVLFGTVLSICFVAYAFSRLEWRGRNIVFAMMMATLMLPPQATLIPQYVLFFRLDWIPGFNPITIPGFFAGGASLVFLLRQFMATLPKDLDEAAMIDGANPLQIWWYVVMPLSGPAVATITVFLFVGQWNNLFMPLIYLKDASLTTMPVYVAGKYNLQESPIPWQDIMTASVLFVIPVMIVFILTQRYFTEGIALTGTKG